MTAPDRSTFTHFDHWLDALVSGMPAPQIDTASNSTTDPATSRDVRNAARQFHELATRADRTTHDLATHERLDTIWEDIMDAHLSPAATVSGQTTPGEAPSIRTWTGGRGAIDRAPVLLARFQPVINVTLAVALILALATGLWRAGGSFDLGFGGDGNGSRTRLAGLVSQASTPEASPVSDIEPAGFVGLTQADCTVAPRTRDEMLSILSTAPSPEGVSLPSEGGDPSPYRQADQKTYDALQEAYSQWQACSLWQMTWQEAAMQSEERIRLDMYLTVRERLNSRAPYDVVSPYSAITLNEILDGWEETDTVRREEREAARREEREAKGFNTFGDFSVIDPATLKVATHGGWASFVTIRLTEDGGSVPLEDEVYFVYQDGAWRLDYRSPCCG